MRSGLALTLLLVSCGSSPPPVVSRPLTVDIAEQRAESGGAAQPSPPPRTAQPPRAEAIDTSSLTERERADLFDSLAELPAPCESVPVSVGECMNERRPCAACVPAALFLMKQVLAGREKTERATAYHARFDSKLVKTIALEGSPSSGPSRAPETIVVWADFECPMCASFEPLLEETARRFPGQVRIVFKNYPIKHHAHAENAARAGIAAQKQGKFWELGHAMFEHQDKLEQKDLEGYAKQVGLDVRKLRADMTSKQTTERLTKDVQDADTLGLQGTPFVFLNGRELDLGALSAKPVDDLVEWVTLDLALAGQEPNAPARGTN